jgi:hypothetical protein
MTEVIQLHARVDISGVYWKARIEEPDSTHEMGDAFAEMTLNEYAVAFNVNFGRISSAGLQMMLKSPPVKQRLTKLLGAALGEFVKSGFVAPTGWVSEAKDEPPRPKAPPMWM